MKSFKDLYKEIDRKFDDLEDKMFPPEHVPPSRYESRWQYLFKCTRCRRIIPKNIFLNHLNIMHGRLYAPPHTLKCLCCNGKLIEEYGLFSAGRWVTRLNIKMPIELLMGFSKLESKGKVVWSK